MSAIKRKLAQIKVLRKIFEAKGTILNIRSKCTYCGQCKKVCSVCAIEVSRNESNWQIDNNICVRCTHCVSVCPTKALCLESSSVQGKYN